MDTKQNCEQRIARHMAGRFDDIRLFTSDPDSLTIEDLLQLNCEEIADELILEELSGELDAFENDVLDETDRKVHREGLLSTFPRTTVISEMETATLSHRQENDIRDAQQERASEYPAGIGVQTIVTIEISGGGPADFFEIRCERGKYNELEPVSGSYHFQDWGDGARRKLSSDELDQVWALWGEGMTL